MKRTVINFSPGPSVLPEEVLLEAQRDFFDFNGSGRSICEMSHRGAEFTKILDEAKENVKRVLSVPDGYSVLFMIGGATAQYAAIPLNLASPTDTADYIVTGSWSKQAADTAKDYCNVNIVATSESNRFSNIPDASSWKFSPNAAYVHYCDNETIDGSEFPFVPEVPEEVPLIVDVSSNFMSRPIDVSKFGMIYGGAQKNCGIAGVTIVIIRNDLLARTTVNSKFRAVPSPLNYKKKHESNSMDNTPPTFNIYMTGLVLKWIQRQGGLDEMFARRQSKGNKIFEVIDGSNGFYRSTVDAQHRSMVNIPFRIKGGDSKLEDAFVAEAEKQQLVDLKGHRSVGGIRVSLYNAMSDEGVDRLVAFMRDFLTRNVC